MFETNMNLRGPVHIPHSSDQTSIFDTVHSRDIKVHIPHSSDQTDTHARIQRFQFAVHIPHSSDQTQYTSMGALTSSAFTSHIVQIKPAQLARYRSRSVRFTSHIVQIKPSERLNKASGTLYVHIPHSSDQTRL